MSKYVFAYHGGSGMPETEQEQAELMAAWGAWFESMGAAVVDGGNPFSQNRTVNPDGSVTADGGANPATGYSVVDAADIDAAIELAKGCPVLAGGGTIEVCEAIDM